MASQVFLYDGDSPFVRRRDFMISSGRAVILRAANLSVPVKIYMKTGNCVACDEDVVWRPLILCDQEVVLSDEEPIIALDIEGNYFLGDPSVANLELGLTANVTLEALSSKDSIPENLKKYCIANEFPDSQVVHEGCTTFLRWFYPSGKVEDTLIDGTPYVVIDPALVEFGPAPESCKGAKNIEIDGANLGYDTGTDPITAVYWREIFNEDTGVFESIQYSLDSVFATPYTPVGQVVPEDTVSGMQYIGNYRVDLTGGEYTAADIVNMAVAAGVYVGTYDRYGKPYERPLTASDWIAQIDIDLKSLDGGIGGLGETGGTTTSAEAAMLEGGQTNLDGGGSRTSGLLKSNGFIIKPQFARNGVLSVAAGSVVPITVVFASNPLTVKP